MLFIKKEYFSCLSRTRTRVKNRSKIGKIELYGNYITYTHFVFFYRFA